MSNNRRSSNFIRDEQVSQYDAATDPKRAALKRLRGIVQRALTVEERIVWKLTIDPHPRTVAEVGRIIRKPSHIVKEIEKQALEKIRACFLSRYEGERSPGASSNIGHGP